MAKVMTATGNYVTINNSAFASQLTEYFKAARSVNKSKWDMAKAVHRIVNSPAYEDEGLSLSKLSDLLDLDKGQISRYANSWTYLQKHTARLVGFTNTAVVELMKLEDNLEDFMGKYEIDKKTTCAKIRKMVKEYLGEGCADTTVVPSEGCADTTTEDVAVELTASDALAKLLSLSAQLQKMSLEESDKTSLRSVIKTLSEIAK